MQRETMKNLNFLLNSTRRSLLRSSPSQRTPWILSPRHTKSPNFTSSHLSQLRFQSSNHKFPSGFSPTLRSLTTEAVNGQPFEAEENMVIEEWEEEDDAEPEIGDGGAGGGIVLQGVPWGEQVLSIANEVLLQFDDDTKLYAFKTSPRGYIYVRLDKLSNEYGCPGMEEIESFSRQYKKRLEEEGSKGVIPDDLALEVSSPGAERILRVPEDLNRFRDFPMVVSYLEEGKVAKFQEKSGIFFVDYIDKESGECVWRMADVKENRDPAGKGRPLSRKLKDWRLKLPFSMLKRVTFYLEF